jgi:hypothetical protein
MEALEPGFHTMVVYHVLAARAVTPPGIFMFSTAELVNVVDLAIAIGCLIDGFARGKRNSQ